ncbi:stabilin-2-like, partial [Plectropomus leopardus]|uniref:stabilin-2-like n=1 Tax=Plectropomus leopardus TaxID=160734 RepID=UPI001C4BC8B8
VRFAGTACEDCAPGRYGPTCSSECSCVHGLCDSGLKGDGRCTCFSGYKGPNCDQELAACASLGCPRGSRCTEGALTARLVCRCLPGHRRSGAQCLPINPCLQRVCHVHASCVHTGPDQHLCTCNAGYSGDGRVCAAVDPCQRDRGGCTAESARCVYDGPGKSHCECLPGFHVLWDGGCSLKDSCTPTSCHRNANCSTVGPGQVECTCLQGYLGNGKVCYGDIMERLNSLNTEPGGQWTGQLSNAITLFGSVSWQLQNLGPFTLFVPINKGFRGTSVRTLLADSSKARYLCKLHLVAGVMPFDTLKKTDVFYTLTGKSAETDSPEGDSQMKIRIHGSRKRGMIVQSDITASNGMIHVINKLMDSVAPTVESDPQENLMKIISDYGKFDRFRSLLEKAGLASVMDLPGPITVFAPTSSAFDAMTEGHLTYLSSAEGRTKLVELLRNHIVPSTSLEVFNAVSSPSITTVANQALTINVTQNGLVLVNGAAVLEAAVEAKNGRLYLLDGVLTPPSIEPVLPRRCDIIETKILKGECVSCSKVKLSQCSPGGVSTGYSTFGCIYTMSIGPQAIKVPATGCSPLCNATVMTAACCKGFYGPDCRPCPGGFQMPCSRHGQCVDGFGGNGTCVCDLNFQGSRCQYCSSSNKYGPNCDTTCPCIHGQCDNRPDSDGRCKVDSCQMGFTGRFCERQTAACGAQVQFCHAHADCDFSHGATRCVCKPGYKGDGITCVESDPCAPPLRGGCSINAKCIKTGAGTHSCQCLTGWREDGDDCQPINNCDGADRGGCHPNATCIYVGPGQSDCSCKAGYKGNGRDCEAANQCVTERGGCHYLASCHLLSSQWTCVCDEGYVGDGHACYGTVVQVLTDLPDASEFSAWTTVSVTPSHHHTVTPSLRHTVTPHSVKPSLCQTVTPSHRHSVTLSHRHSVTPSHRHSVTPSLRHTVTPSHRHSVTPSLCHIVTPSNRHSVTPSHRHSVTPSNRHSVKPSNRHSVKPSLRQTVTPSHRHSVTPSLRHTVTLSHSHSIKPSLRQTVTPSNRHSVTLSHRHSVTPSLRHTVTPSLHHTVTPSHRHSVTPSLRHIVTPSNRQTVKPSLRHTVTPSHRHSVTQSHRHTVTPSLRHTVTPSLRHIVTPSLHHTFTQSLRHTVTPSHSHSVTPSLRHT